MHDAGVLRSCGVKPGSLCGPLSCARMVQVGIFAIIFRVLARVWPGTTLAVLVLCSGPGEPAFLLIRCSATKASLEPVGESASQQLADSKKDMDALIEG